MLTKAANMSTTERLACALMMDEQGHPSYDSLIASVSKWLKATRAQQDQYLAAATTLAEACL